jgi:hypothetical protein
MPFRPSAIPETINENYRDTPDHMLLMRFCELLYAQGRIDPQIDNDPNNVCNGGVFELPERLFALLREGNYDWMDKFREYALNAFALDQVGQVLTPVSLNFDSNIQACFIDVLNESLLPDKQVIADELPELVADALRLNNQVTPTLIVGSVAGVGPRTP